MTRSVLLVLGLLPPLACQPDSRDVGGLWSGSSSSNGASGSSTDADSGTSDGPGTGDGSGASGSATGPGGSGGSSGEGDGIRFDTPDGNTGPGDGPGGEGCKKVDFLFVVDNSGSMYARQQVLTAAFPQFIDTIESRLGTSDYQIMVVDSDASTSECSGLPPPECWDRCQQMGGYTCEQGTEATDCSMVTPEPLDACDRALGGGTVKDRFDQSCGVMGGNRFIMQGQPNLSDTFTCIAQTGSGGCSNEQPYSAMEAAVTTLDQPGQCNDGFVRDDAILVVTVLSDAVSPDMKMDPNRWYDALVQAKKGHPEAIVVMALLRSNEAPGTMCAECGGMPVDPCAGHTGDEFVAMFGDRGFIHSICEANYNDFFAMALDAIDLTCEEFTPVG